jgi:hypothetical protein
LSIGQPVLNPPNGSASGLLHRGIIGEIIKWFARMKEYYYIHRTLAYQSGILSSKEK